MTLVISTHGCIVADRKATMGGASFETEKVAIRKVRGLPAIIAVTGMSSRVAKLLSTLDSATSAGDFLSVAPSTETEAVIIMRTADAVRVFDPEEYCWLPIEGYVTILASFGQLRFTYAREYSGSATGPARELNRLIPAEQVMEVMDRAGTPHVGMGWTRAEFTREGREIKFTTRRRDGRMSSRAYSLEEWPRTVEVPGDKVPD